MFRLQTTKHKSLTSSFFFQNSNFWTVLRFAKKAQNGTGWLLLRFQKLHEKWKFQSCQPACHGQSQHQKLRPVCVVGMVVAVVFVSSKLLVSSARCCSTLASSASMIVFFAVCFYSIRSPPLSRAPSPLFEAVNQQTLSPQKNKQTTLHNNHHIKPHRKSVWHQPPRPPRPWRAALFSSPLQISGLWLSPTVRQHVPPALLFRLWIRLQHLVGSVFCGPCAQQLDMFGLTACCSQNHREWIAFHGLCKVNIAELCWFVCRVIRKKKRKNWKTEKKAKKQRRRLSREVRRNENVPVWQQKKCDKLFTIRNIFTNKTKLNFEKNGAVRNWLVVETEYVSVTNFANTKRRRKSSAHQHWLMHIMSIEGKTGRGRDLGGRQLLYVKNGPGKEWQVQRVSPRQPDQAHLRFICSFCHSLFFLWKIKSTRKLGTRDSKCSKIDNELRGRTKVSMGMVVVETYPGLRECHITSLEHNAVHCGEGLMFGVRCVCQVCLACDIQQSHIFVHKKLATSTWRRCMNVHSTIQIVAMRPRVCPTLFPNFKSILMVNQFVGFENHKNNLVRLSNFHEQQKQFEREKGISTHTNRFHQILAQQRKEKGGSWSFVNSKREDIPVSNKSKCFFTQDQMEQIWIPFFFLAHWMMFEFLSVILLLGETTFLEQKCSHIWQLFLNGADHEAFVGSMWALWGLSSWPFFWVFLWFCVVVCCGLLNMFLFSIFVFFCFVGCKAFLELRNILTKWPFSLSHKQKKKEKQSRCSSQSYTMCFERLCGEWRCEQTKSLASFPSSQKGLSRHAHMFSLGTGTFSRLKILALVERKAASKPKALVTMFGHMLWFEVFSVPEISLLQQW